MERGEIEKDLRKVKLQKLLFLLGGLGLFGLAIALFVTFVVRREVPALILACAALIFGAILLNQSMRSRDLEDMITERLSSHVEGETVALVPDAGGDEEREEEERGGESDGGGSDGDCDGDGGGGDR